MMKTGYLRGLIAVSLFFVLAGCTQAKQAVSTPPNFTPAPGDLGWGSVSGRVIDTISEAPIAGATVTCAHWSNHPVHLCSGTVKTAKDGSFVFPEIFFQSTDRIELSASAPSYGGDFFRQEYFLKPDLQVVFSLPVVNPSPQPCCTPPSCRGNEVLSCPGVCPCGCGTICATPTMPPG